MNIKENLKKYRINEAEYSMICESLGRPPEGVEWALFSALWSEHCSYKSTRKHLKKFSYKNSRVLESFGENAGVVDLGQGERVAFKMESHNHPSFIEPYEGAATGVGGILRDIFTMGARPIALANYLCFGNPNADRMPSLVDGVVRGIGGYGNCVGVPNITGATEFHSSYNGNILVNAFAMGLFRPDDKVFTSRKSEVGHLVVYVGSKTGRDGVHGASMASESFDDDSESKKPTIQKGDPFLEKLLIESCIEVMKMGLVESIQDMGAAGLTSSSFEMADKAKVGLHIHLDKVPLRDLTMEPEEILLSESQERMLLMCQPHNVEKLKAVFEKWDLDAEVIGEVVSDKKVTLYWNDELLTSIDPAHLVDNAPSYSREYNEWKPSHEVASRDDVLHESVADLNKELCQYFGSPHGCKKNWIYDQYDQRVGGGTSKDCSFSIGVNRLPDSGRLLGTALGCRPYQMRLDAKIGGADAMIFPALKLAAKGFTPLAITDCLNFGNPEKPELMTELVAAIDSLAAYSEALDIPVISGNVSLYNETLGSNVTSTPSTAVVGLREKGLEIPSDVFNGHEDEIYLLEYLGVTTNGRIADTKNETAKYFGELEPQKVADFTAAVQNLATLEYVRSSQVVSSFGVLGTLLKMATNEFGFDINNTEWLKNINSKNIFNENLYSVLFTVPSHKGGDFLNQFKLLNSQFSFKRLGYVKKQKYIFGKHEIDFSAVENKFVSGWGSLFETLA